ncbi:MAG: hypothetical protein SOI13_01455 [Bifidobacterium mongoliense]|uniref:hypothetical protein n=1 Tax=Bifidobacterium mongoliense TaxID=518643 RepID=UPI002F356840
MRTHRFTAVHPDTGETLGFVKVQVYAKLKGMRMAAEAFNGSDTKRTLGVTQAYTNGDVIMRLARDYINLRSVTHECSHAALCVVEHHRGGAPIVSTWVDETYCHVFDDIVTDIYAWLIEEFPEQAQRIDFTEKQYKEQEEKA